VILGLRSLIEENAPNVTNVIDCGNRHLLRRSLGLRFGRVGNMFRLARRNMLLLLTPVFAFVLVGATQQRQPKTEKAPVEAKEWFRAYCAPCHGADAKGHGPAASALKVPPPDLTTLAKRNNGKFPEDYFKKVLVHGVAVPAHGTAEMPIWGPTFAGVNERQLTQYLESVQAK
jgi:mono/diheme cytochrome c family protein